jgi:hypothetical protein
LKMTVSTTLLRRFLQLEKELDAAAREAYGRPIWFLTVRFGGSETASPQEKILMDKVERLLGECALNKPGVTELLCREGVAADQGICFGSPCEGSALLDAIACAWGGEIFPNPLQQYVSIKKGIYVFLEEKGREKSPASAGSENLRPFPPRDGRILLDDVETFDGVLRVLEEYEIKPARIIERLQGSGRRAGFCGTLEKWIPTTPPCTDQEVIDALVDVLQSVLTPAAMRQRTGPTDSLACAA